GRCSPLLLEPRRVGGLALLDLGRTLLLVLGRPARLLVEALLLLGLHAVLLDPLAVTVVLATALIFLMARDLRLLRSSLVVVELPLLLGELASVVLDPSALRVIPCPPL